MNDMIDRLLFCMKTKGISQKELASRIHVAPTTLNGFLKRHYDSSDRTIRDICAALRIREEWLRDGVEPMEKTTSRTVVDDLAQAYGLTPAVTALLDVLAQAFVELDEEAAEGILRRLREALAALPDAEAVEAAVHTRLTAQVDDIEASDAAKDESPA